MMTSDQWRRVRDLFEAAIERTPEDRHAWLDAQGIDDPVVRGELVSLLDHHSRAGAFLERPLAEDAPDLLAEPDRLAAGAAVGHYRIVRELGRGATGRVYLASDSRLNRTVALKALAPTLTADPGYRERLRREAQAAAALRHPGICTVHALEEIDGELFIVSEAIEGRTLREEIGSGGVPSTEAIVRTARELADALAAAHVKGIVHRDLKPENVMRDRDGRVRILDFGLARLTAAAPPADVMLATAPGALMGTPAYMAPEQINAAQADVRSDVFAFGVLVYEYACGVHPFEASTALGRLARVLESDPRPIAERCARVPPALAAVVDRCLRKSPADRYASAAGIVAALSDVAAGGGGRFGRQHWWRIHQAAIVLLYLVACAVAWSLKEAFAGVWFLWVFIAVGAASGAAAIARGHLVFTERMNRPRLAGERRRVAPLILAADAIVSAGLGVDALRIAPQRPLWTVLVIALATGLALAALVMEPATTAAVFADDRH